MAALLFLKDLKAAAFILKCAHATRVMYKMATTPRWSVLWL